MRRGVEFDMLRSRGIYEFPRAARISLTRPHLPILQADLDAMRVIRRFGEDIFNDAFGLLLRLLARGDAHELLYERYVDTLDQLAGEAGTTDYERATFFEQILRRFEKNLLSEIGYGATFDVDVDNGAAIEPDRRYVFQPERGALRATGEQGRPVSGQTLIDLAAGRFERQATLVEAKALMRTLINHTLGEKPLYTRQLLRELTDLSS